MIKIAQKLLIVDNSLRKPRIRFVDRRGLYFSSYTGPYDETKTPIMIKSWIDASIKRAHSQLVPPIHVRSHFISSCLDCPPDRGKPIRLNDMRLILAYAQVSY